MSDEIKTPRRAEMPKRGGGIVDDLSVSYPAVNNNHSPNPLKAIRAKCLDCCCDSPVEVRLCPSRNCALHPFRLGTNPFRRKRVLTEAQRQAASDRLAKARKGGR